jgi:lysophospholipase-2
MRPSLFFTTSLSLSPHLLLLHSRIVRGLSSSSTALHSISRSNDGTVIISPKDEAQHSATVVLCHGLGDTANGWVEPTQYLANQLPHVKWILPTAPTQPVTLNMGMAMPSWYDIVGLDSRSSELCNGLDESMERILSLVENEVSGVDSSTTTASACVNPLDYSRIVVAGFSQGGALALYTGMTQLRKQRNVGLGLGGITVMSGYLPRSKAFAIAAGSEKTPILHCHGEQDSVVPVQAAAVSKERVSSLLKEMGVGNENNSYEVKTYAGLDHSVSIEELNDVAAFLKRVIPPIARKTDDAQEEEAVVAAVDPKAMSVRELKAEIEKRGLKEEARGMLEKSDLVKLLLKNQK